MGDDDDFLDLLERSDDWSITCESGVTFSTDAALAVYGIIDVPPKDDYTSRKQTRIVAVDTTGAAEPTVRWTSEPLEGELVGTPVVSADGRQIMFTRNSVPPPEAPTAVPTTSAPTSSAPTTNTPSTLRPTTASPTREPTAAPTEEIEEVEEGRTRSTNSTSTTNAADDEDNRRSLQNDPRSRTAYFTVLDATTGAVLLDEPSPALLATHLYSPVAIAHSIVSSSSSSLLFQGATPGADLVIWHSSDSADGGGETQVYQYVPPSSTTDANGTDTTTTTNNDNNSPAAASVVGTTIQLSSSDWTTQTAPTISSQSGSLFMGTSHGSIRGWRDGRSYELVSNFEVELFGGRGMPATQGVLNSNNNDDHNDDDDSLLYVSTAGNSFAAVNVATAEVQWTIPSEDASTMHTRAVPAPDGSRVYVSIGSRLYAKDAATGADIWQVNNGDGLPVQADFAVSRDGRFVYYVGFRENIVTALEVATMIPIVPTALPTLGPTTGPTISPAPTVERTDSPTRAPTVFADDPTTTPPPPREVAPETTTTTKRQRNFPLYALVAMIVGGVLLLGAIVMLGLWFLRGRGGASSEGIEMNYDFSQQARQQQQPTPAAMPASQGPTIRRPKRYSYDPTKV